MNVCSHRCVEDHESVQLAGVRLCPKQRVLSQDEALLMCVEERQWMMW